jgi:hypothetical protein
MRRRTQKQCHAERSKIARREILRSRSIPTSIPNPDLSALLAKCDAKLQRSTEDDEWLASKPVGRELIE